MSLLLTPGSFFRLAAGQLQGLQDCGAQPNKCLRFPTSFAAGPVTKIRPRGHEWKWRVQFLDHILTKAFPLFSCSGTCICRRFSFDHEGKDSTAQCGSHCGVSKPPVSPSHEYLLEMHMLGFHSDLLNQKLWGGLRKPSRWFWCSKAGTAAAGFCMVSEPRTVFIFLMSCSNQQQPKKNKSKEEYNWDYMWDAKTKIFTILSFTETVNQPLHWSLRTTAVVVSTSQWAGRSLGPWITNTVEQTCSVDLVCASLDC